MKYSFEARMEALDNRRKIIDNNVNGAIDAIEKAIDEAIKIGEIECVVSLGSFLNNFENETKTAINNNLSMYGYRVGWRGYYAVVNYKEG